MDKPLEQELENDWEKYVDVDFDIAPINVTEEIINSIKRYSLRYGGNARVAMGYILTDKDLENRRKEVYPLP